MQTERNVLGTELQPCSADPLTGYHRDGYCRQDDDNVRKHRICAVLTHEFLKYTNRTGTDIMRPRPIEEISSLRPGDHWCVGVDRWLEARNAGFAPPVVLEATSEAVLDDIPFETLKEHEFEGGRGYDEGGLSL